MFLCPLRSSWLVVLCGLSDWFGFADMVLPSLVTFLCYGLVLWFATLRAQPCDGGALPHQPLVRRTAALAGALNGCLAEHGDDGVRCCVAWRDSALHYAHLYLRQLPGFNGLVPDVVHWLIYGRTRTCLFACGG